MKRSDPVDRSFARHLEVPGVGALGDLDQTIRPVTAPPLKGPPSNGEPGQLVQAKHCSIHKLGFSKRRHVQSVMVYPFREQIP
jgi:hypothetical protein